MKEYTAGEVVLTLVEAANFIRVSDKTMGELARSGRVPARKVGREWRFLRRSLEDWLSGKEAPPGNGPTALQPQVAEAAAQYELPIAGFRDTAFTENRHRALHRWVPWIAGFSGSFVAGVLHSARRGGGRLRVLDPFAGVGTTLIEALRQGDDAVGFEINPYAALACKVKANVLDYDVDQFSSAIERFEYFGRQWELSGVVASTPPPGFVSRAPFFSAQVQPQVLACLDFQRSEVAGWVQDLFRVAFGSVMVGFSNYSYEPSLGTRAGAGKPNVEQADVFGILAGKLNDMREDIIAFQQELRAVHPQPRAVVHHSSYMRHAECLPPNSINLIITSPPYLNNYHYIRNTRPQLYWLGMVESPADLKEMERGSFGQFWQTVRTGPEVPLRPELPRLSDKIKALKMRNAAKGAYGGPGWANYAATYFNDCQRFCVLTRKLMKPGGTVVVVIGNNILQGVEFPTDQIFAEIAEQEGFSTVALHEVRSKRTGNSVVNSAVRIGEVPTRTRLYETAVELRSP